MREKLEFTIYDIFDGETFPFAWVDKKTLLLLCYGRDSNSDLPHGVTITMGK